MKVTRTLEVNDLTPSELAHLFGEFDNFGQAEFFAVLWQIGKTWPNSGWCGQAYSIVEQLDMDGRSAVAALADHLNAQVSA